MSPVIVKGFLSTDPVIQLFSVRAALTLLDSKPETLFVTRLAEEDRPTLVERARPFVQDAMSPLRNLVESDHQEISRSAVRLLSLLVQLDAETASNAHKLMATSLRSRDRRTVFEAAEAYSNELSRNVPVVIVEALTQCVETERRRLNSLTQDRFPDYVSLNTNQPGGFCFYALSKQGKAAANAIPMAMGHCC
jgi:hypothetical protein